jgi:hypothetical protein
LQNSRREIDVVLLRLIVGVHGRLAHHPFFFVDGLSDFRELAAHLISGRPLTVAEEIATIRWSTDTDGEGGEDPAVDGGEADPKICLKVAGSLSPVKIR